MQRKHIHGSTDGLYVKANYFSLNFSENSTIFIENMIEFNEIYAAQIIASDIFLKYLIHTKITINHRFFS